MGTWTIIDEDLTPEFVKFAKKHHPKDEKDPIFKATAAYRFNPTLEFDDKVEKLMGKDAFFKKKLEDCRDNDCKQAYGEMMLDIEKEIQLCAKGWLKAKNDPMAPVKNSDAFDKLTKTLESLIKKGGHKIESAIREVGNAYILNRHEGKIAVKEYKVSVVKGSLKTIVAVAELGASIAEAVGTFGATAPGCVVAAYNVALEARQTYQIYNKWKTEIDEWLEKIKTTKEKLDKEFTSGGASAADRKKINFSELKAKAGAVLTGKTPKSIKYVEECVGHLEKHVKIGYLNNSNGGKLVTKFQNSTKECLLENENQKRKIEANTKLLPAGFVSKNLEKLKKSTENYNKFLSTTIPEMLKALEAEETRLAEISATVVPEAKKWVDDYKKQRDGFVKSSTVPIQIGKLLLSVAACNFTDAGSSGLELLEMGLDATKDVAEGLAEIVKDQMDKKKEKK